MKRSKLFLGISLICAIGITNASAGMLAAGPNDLVSNRVAKAAGTNPPVVEANELHYAWRSDAKQAALVPFESVSREYWADYSGAQLSAGIAIHTTAPGAVVRISPAQGTPVAIEPEMLQVQHAGQVYANATGLTSVASAEDLAGGIPNFPDGTTAFRLSAELGPGDFRLSAPVSSGQYLVHVYEPDSELQLKLSAASDALLSGQTLQLSAQFETAGRTAAVDSISGVLTAPDGRSFDLTYRQLRDGSYSASVEVPEAAQTDGPVLWEVHTFTSAGQVQRDAKTAVAIASATARLSGTAERLALRARGTNVVVQFGVDANLSARLQLTGTLWGTNAKGALVPVAVAQTAKSMAGSADDYLELRFLTGVVDPAGVRAPFEIRDLRLQDQADMGLMERRERAWVSN